MDREAPPSVPSPVNARSTALLTLALGALTVSLSVTQITFNSFLMKDGRFPYAAVLVFTHMGFCSVLTVVLRFASPTLFPSLTHPDQQVRIKLPCLVRMALPLSLAFAGHLVGSNMAYRHLSVAFLQMMKETNLVLVYVFAVCAAQECLSW